ncbi:MAG: PepSY domain-containing protein [Halomonas sp.]|uniref:PepSY domain-containing protein n=1 Tax=Halomonas TaxID=2745 RepID=UPI000485CF09|nr:MULTISPECIES: PepSY domain-containing protein [Halomonas]NWN83555.1 PepSY domain-containing protein [Halomonas sp.]
MKTPLLVTTALAATLTATMTLADDDCRDTVADWQPRDVLRQKLETKGWEVRRIKVDDGCYEVEGLDQDGNKVEADYTPASLRLRKLEIEYEEDAAIPDSLYSGDRDRDYDDDDDREDSRRRSSTRTVPNGDIVSGRPSVRIE